MNEQDIQATATDGTATDGTDGTATDAGKPAASSEQDIECSLEESAKPYETYSKDEIDAMFANVAKRLSNDKFFMKQLMVKDLILYHEPSEDLEVGALSTGYRLRAGSDIDNDPRPVTCKRVAINNSAENYTEYNRPVEGSWGLIEGNFLANSQLKYNYLEPFGGPVATVAMVNQVDEKYSPLASSTEFIETSYAALTLPKQKWQSWAIGSKEVVAGLTKQGTYLASGRLLVREPLATSTDVLVRFLLRPANFTADAMPYCHAVTRFRVEPEVQSVCFQTVIYSPPLTGLYHEVFLQFYAMDADVPLLNNFSACSYSMLTSEVPRVSATALFVTDGPTANIYAEPAVVSPRPPAPPDED